MIGQILEYASRFLIIGRIYFFAFKEKEKFHRKKEKNF